MAELVGYWSGAARTGWTAECLACCMLGGQRAQRAAEECAGFQLNSRQLAKLKRRKFIDGREKDVARQRNDQHSMVHTSGIYVVLEGFCTLSILKESTTLAKSEYI